MKTNPADSYIYIYSDILDTHIWVVNVWFSANKFTGGPFDKSIHLIFLQRIRFETDTSYLNRYWIFDMRFSMTSKQKSLANGSETKTHQQEFSKTKKSSYHESLSECVTFSLRWKDYLEFAGKYFPIDFV